MVEKKKKKYSPEVEAALEALQDMRKMEVFQKKDTSSITPKNTTPQPPIKATKTTQELFPTSTISPMTPVAPTTPSAPSTTMDKFKQQIKENQLRYQKMKSQEGASLEYMQKSQVYSTPPKVEQSPEQIAYIDTVTEDKKTAPIGESSPLVGTFNRTLYSTFGERISPEYGIHVFSPGIDIEAEEGEMVESMANGTVLFARKLSHGMGKVVMIEHEDGYLAVYQSLSYIGVKAGDKVSKGQAIAEVGAQALWGAENMGKIMPHLHIQIREPKHNEEIDPIKYMRSL